MHSKKYFYFNTFSQYLTLVFNIVVGVFLIPYYFNFISIEIYGIWIASLSTISIFLLIDPGFTFVMPQHIARINKYKDKEMVRKFLCESLVLAFFLSSLIFLFLIILLNFGSYFFAESITFDFINKHLSYVYVYILTQFFIVVFNSLSIGLKVIWFNGLITHVANVIGIILIIIFLRLGYGLPSFFYTLIIKNIFIVASSFLYYRNFLFFMNFSEMKFEVYRENAKLQTFATLLSELPKSLPNIVIGTYAPSLVSSLKILQSIPELARGIIEKPVYVSMPIIAERTSLKEPSGLNYRHLFLFIVYLFFNLSIFFILFNKILINIWIGNVKGLDITNNIVMIFYVTISLISKIMTYVVYSIGEAKKINMLITKISIIGTFASFLLFHYNYVIYFFTILILIEIYVIFKLVKLLGFLKTLDKSSIFKFIISTANLLVIVFISSTDLFFSYLPNILLFLFTSIVLIVIYKADLSYILRLLLKKN